MARSEVWIKNISAANKKDGVKTNLMLLLLCQSIGSTIGMPGKHLPFQKIFIS